MSTPGMDTAGGHVQGGDAGHGPGTRWEYDVDPDTGEVVRWRTSEPPYTGPGQDTGSGHDVEYTSRGTGWMAPGGHYFRGSSIQGDMRGRTEDIFGPLTQVGPDRHKVLGGLSDEPRHTEPGHVQTRRVDGRPETDKDTRFFDLRESGYRGDIDQDGYPVGHDPAATSGSDTTPEGDNGGDTTMRETIGRSNGATGGQGGGGGQGNGGGGSQEHDHTTAIQSLGQAGGGLEGDCQQAIQYAQHLREEVIPKAQKLEETVRAVAEDADTFGRRAASTAQELLDKIRKAIQAWEEAAQKLEEGAKLTMEVLEGLAQLMRDLQTARGE